MSSRLFRFALTAVAGLVAALSLPAPASADVPPVRAQNDGQSVCFVTGDIVVLWHGFVEPGFSVALTDGDPPSTILVDADPLAPNNLSVVQFVPNGTTAAKLNIHWVETANPQNTGTETFSVTPGNFPADCPSKVSAEFTPRCDRQADVTLHNDSDTSLAFAINGVSTTVAAGQSAVVENVAVPADSLIKVTVDDRFLKGIPVDTFTWTGACPPSPSPSASDVPPLAVTGSSLTGVIAVGGGLLAAGAVLVVVSMMLRRRRSTSG